MWLEVLMSAVRERNQPHICRGDGSMVSVNVVCDAKPFHEFQDLVVRAGAVGEGPNMCRRLGWVPLDSQAHGFAFFDIPAVIVIFAFNVPTPPLALCQRKN